MTSTNIATLRQLIDNASHYRKEDLAIAFIVPIVPALPAAGLDGELKGIYSGSTLTIYVYNLSAGAWETFEGGANPATTVESETTFGISSAVGTGTKYARDDHTHGSPTDPVTAHEAAATVHAASTNLEKIASKGAANGYAGLDATTKVPTAQLATGTPSSSNFLRGDRTWSAASGGGEPALKAQYIDAGTMGGTATRAWAADLVYVQQFPKDVVTAAYRSIVALDDYTPTTQIGIHIFWRGSNDPEAGNWYCDYSIAGAKSGDDDLFAWTRGSQILVSVDANSEQLRKTTVAVTTIAGDDADFMRVGVKRLGPMKAIHTAIPLSFSE